MLLLNLFEIYSGILPGPSAAASPFNASHEGPSIGGTPEPVEIPVQRPTGRTPVPFEVPVQRSTGRTPIPVEVRVQPSAARTPIPMEVPVHRSTGSTPVPIEVPVQQRRSGRARTRTRSITSVDVNPIRERSRSRSPIRSRTITPEGGETTNSNRGRRPNVAAMPLVPSQNWRIRSLADIGEGSKLFILSDVQNQLGREFTFSQQFEDGFMFQCDNCMIKSAARTRTKGYLKFFSGNVVVREGKHYATCKPFKLGSLPPPLPENDAPEDEK